MPSAFSKGSSKRSARAIEEASQRATEEIRRQFGETQQTLDPFVQAGVGQLPTLESAATVGGFDQRLGDIFNTDIFGALADQRRNEIQGQLAAGGLTRSGTALDEISKLPADIGFAIEQLLQGRSAGLAGQGLNAASQLGSFGANTAQGIAGQQNLAGQARAQGILGAGQERERLFGDLFGSGEQFGGNLVQAGAFLFSDPNLKDNIEKIGEVHDLNLYQWDWKEEADGTMVKNFPTVGFLTTEVKEKYPQFVSTYAGFEGIYYDALLTHLENK